MLFALHKTSKREKPTMCWYQCMAMFLLAFCIYCTLVHCVALVCFCAVCSRVAPWTGPAHCVHLLCRWRSSRLQHHCYSHPEIVSRSHTYTHVSVVPHQTACLRWHAAREFQDAITHIAPVLVLPVFSWKKKSSFIFGTSSPSLFLSPFFCVDPSALLPSPQEVTSLGDEAVSLCRAASPKPVFLFNSGSQ